MSQSEEGTLGDVTNAALGERALSGGEGRRPWKRIAAAVFLLVVAVSGARVAARYRPLTYLMGDCPYYALTAESILHDRDLDLRNQLRGGLEVHGRQIALGADGAWYPKHPILMPIAALPFVLALGVPGTLAFNLVVLGLLAVTMLALARTVAPPAAAAAAALALTFGTFLRAYDYNFSPDLFATLVLCTGILALLRGRDALGGLLLGLAVAAKITHLFLLPLGPAYAAWCRGRRAGARSAAAALVPLLLLGALNLRLFGSPFTTAYDRNVTVEAGTIATVSHRGLFDNHVAGGLAGEIFDPDHGLLPTAPAILLALPGSVLMFRRRPREALLCLAIGEFLLLLFATYRYWSSSHYGNRFLMPLIVLAAPPAALTIDWIFERVRRAAARGAAGEAEAAP